MHCSDTLTRFRDEAEKFLRCQGTEPVAGSKAATERATYPRPDSPLTVAAIAGVLIESVGKHFTAFVKTITEPVEPIACWTCVRSMLESSAIAAWLFDPDVDVQTRVGRSFAIRYEGMDQEVKLARSIGRSHTEMQGLEDNINKVENIAFGLGFSRLRNKKGDRIGIGQPMPSATEIIKVVLGEEFAYRLLSAVAHGHFWAIYRLGFKEVVSRIPQTSKVPLTVIEKHSGSVQGYAFLSVRVLKALGLPLWRQCLYYGWDKDRLVTLLEGVYDDLEAAPEIRYWRARN